MGVHLRFEEKQLSEAFVVTDLSRRSIDKQGIIFLSQESLLPWYRDIPSNIHDFWALCNSLPSTGPFSEKASGHSEDSEGEEWNRTLRLATEGEEKGELRTIQPIPLF